MGCKKPSEFYAGICGPSNPPCSRDRWISWSATHLFAKPPPGRINPNQQRAVARHEIRVTLLDVVKAASDHFKERGAVCTCLYLRAPAGVDPAYAELSRIEPKNVRFIHSRKDSESKLMMMEGVKQGRPGLKVGPPIVIYNARWYIHGRSGGHVPVRT